MKKLLTILLALSLFSILAAQEQGSQEVKKAHNFMLEDLNGDDVELFEQLGEGPIILSFWATWCKPCIEEMKEFNKLYELYKKDGLQLIAISTDSERSVAKVKPFIKSKGYSFTVLYDTNEEVKRAYYAQVIPFTLILDKNGSIAYSHVGYKKGDEKAVEEIIKSLL